MSSRGFDRGTTVKSKLSVGVIGVKRVHNFKNEPFSIRSALGVAGKKSPFKHRICKMKLINGFSLGIVSDFFFFSICKFD